MKREGRAGAAASTAGSAGAEVWGRAGQHSWVPAAPSRAPNLPPSSALFSSFLSCCSLPQPQISSLVAARIGSQGWVRAGGDPTQPALRRVSKHIDERPPFVHLYHQTQLLGDVGEALTRFGAQILHEPRRENASMGNAGRVSARAAPHRPAAPPRPGLVSPPLGSRSAAASAVRHPPARGRKRSGTGGGAEEGEERRRK